MNFSQKERNLIIGTLVFGVFFLFISQILSNAAEKQVTPNYDTPITIVTPEGQRHHFIVEVANTKKKHETGLMYRRDMPENAGMIFPMKKSEMQVFWMKNTYIPLDIMFVEHDGIINQIHHNATPLDTTNIPSKQPAKAVLEINGGLSQSLGIAEGSRIIHPFFLQKDGKDGE